MPGRLRKHIEADEELAGFLKPTVSSQRRCIKQPSHSNLLKTERLRKTAKKTKFVQQLKASKSATSCTRNGTEVLPSAVEVYAGIAPNHSRNSEQIKSSHPELCEAKKMCEELKEQIHDLKLQQKTYEERLKYNYLAQPTTHDLHMLNSCSCNQNLLNNNKEQKSIKTCTVNSNEASIFNEKTEIPLQDSSNLPGQVSYNSIFHRPGSSDSIIRKLHSERDRYKRRVIKLQQELKSVKNHKKFTFKSPEIPINDLTFYNADMIGEGHLAVVYEGTLHGKAVAVKKLIRSGVMTSSDRSYLAAEAGLLLPLNHRNIVRLMGVCSTPMEPLIVTEFVNGKALSEMLNKSGGGLDPASFFAISRDIAIGMAYLHSQKPPVLHLNLRPANIHVDAYLRAKVADFGFSKIRIDAGVSNSSNLAYLAPELLRFPAQITIKTDVYAFAILMWQMTTGRDPMAKRTTSQILDMMEHDQRLRIRSDLPVGVQQLINVCWDPSPAQRPTFKEIIIEFETMTLPSEWISKLKDVGITRTNTSDLGTTRDACSMLSSHTSLRDGDQAETDQVNENTEIKPELRPFHVNRNRSTFLSQEQQYTEGKANSKESFDEKDPPPVTNVRYIPHNLQNDISKPVIFEQKKKFFPDDVYSKVSPALLNTYSCSTTSENKPLPSIRVRYAWSGEPYSGDIRRDEPSKFESKFRDYVSDACQAESVHKARTTAFQKRPNCPLDLKMDQKTKTFLSSENVKVHSVGTQSCSTLTSASNNSSVDAAIKLSSCHRQTSDVSVAIPPLNENFVISSQAKFQTDMNKEIVDNAKRLLSSSPLQSYGQTKYQHFNNYSLPCPKVKPLPEYIPQNGAVRRLCSERAYVPSESSDFSAESFLPLPPKLRNHQCLLLNEHHRNNQKYHLPSSINHDFQNERISPNNSDVLLQNSQKRPNTADVNDTNSDKVSRILTQTAKELNNASCMLYSATEELQKRKLNGSM